MYYGIVGYGVLGKAMATCFTRNGKSWWAHDTVGTKVPKPMQFSQEKMDTTEVVFICVPTPAYGECGGYNLANVDNALANLVNQGYRGIVVVSSTIAPHDYALLRSNLYTLVVAPEFLRARHAAEDMWEPSNPCVYGPRLASKEKEAVLLEALRARHRTPVAYTAYRPEVCCLIKQGTNLALAMKLATASLIHTTATNCGMSKKEATAVLNSVFADPRLETAQQYHNVGRLGFKQGFGGHCLPKDVMSMSTDCTVHDKGRNFLDALIVFNNWLRTL